MAAAALARAGAAGITIVEHEASVLTSADLAIDGLLGIGARRAAAVRDYMIARGLGASRIRTVSYGKERPVAVCDDISCWSQNRRAVTILGA